MIRSGVRVIRGPDWSHGNQDGGNGYLGTVLDFSRETRQCRVFWDVGHVTADCKAEGDEGKSELRIYDNKQAGIQHCYKQVIFQHCYKQVIFNIVTNK